LPKVTYCKCQQNEPKWEIKKKTGGPNGGPTKIWGDHGPPWSPFRIAIAPFTEYFRPGVSNLFCPRATQAIPQQFEGRTSYVIRLFSDMSHSAKSTRF